MPNEAYRAYLNRTLGRLLIAIGSITLIALVVTLAFMFAISDGIADPGIALWLLLLWGAAAVALGLFVRRTELSVAALLLGHVFLVIPAGLALMARF